MQLKNFALSTFLAINLTAALPAKAADVLTGDTRLACEALLCMASGTVPTECMPSLRRYFSIVAGSWRHALQGRLDFLNLCPVSNQLPEMNSLINGLANGAGRCDTQSLNITLRSYSEMYQNGTMTISNQMPDYCGYLNHQYTDLSSTIPVYVGIPSRGGYWVDAADYEAHLAAYNARIAAEDAAAEAERLRQENRR